jgi:hypothetical protein
MNTPFRSSRHGQEILVADWRDAEELAAWFMRETLSMDGARTTGSGNDEGIDVVSEMGVAQVKHLAEPIGGPVVQSALGAGHGSPVVLFFALSGFTRQALDFAHRTGVALFTYDIYGSVSAINAPARTLISVANQPAGNHVSQMTKNPDEAALQGFPRIRGRGRARREESLNLLAVNVDVPQNSSASHPTS